MKTKFYFFVFILLALVFQGCSRGDFIPERINIKPAAQADFLQRPAAVNSSTGKTEFNPILRSLDELAELERAGSWFQGMALAESSIRESMGDYEGAVAAAYKEVAWAYGKGLIQKEELELGMLNLLEARDEESVVSTATAIILFLNGQWDDAIIGLRSLFIELDEPDGFARWMILVCALEKNKAASIAEDRRAAAAYKSIRARYVQFPEYWYRGARAFSGIISADYAENCINTSPSGPFADECRAILASYSGLGNEYSSSIKTMKEIETIISQSVNSGNPEFLNSLFPLISLPDNPYTVYAVGALRSLTGAQIFRDYFLGQVMAASGRLAERLSYICHG